MRTTMDIDDELLRAATSRASLDRSTLGAVVEQALREYLPASGPSPRGRRPIRSFTGRGYNPVST